MASSVMVHDVKKIGCIFEGRDCPVKRTKPFMNVGVTRPNIPDITLEVIRIDWLWSLLETLIPRRKNQSKCVVHT